MADKSHKANINTKWAGQTHNCRGDCQGLIQNEGQTLALPLNTFRSQNRSQGTTTECKQEIMMNPCSVSYTNPEVSGMEKSMV